LLSAWQPSAKASRRDKYPLKRSDYKQQLLFCLAAEAFQFTDGMAAGRSTQIGESIDAQFAVEDLDTFWAAARQPQQVTQALGDLATQFAAQRQVACVHDRGDFPCEIRPNPWQFCQLLPIGRYEFSQRLWKISNRAGRIAIGAHTKRIRRLQFQKISDLVKDLCDFGVFHRVAHR
jgi:hypothetical protein